MGRKSGSAKSPASNGGATTDTRRSQQDGTDPITLADGTQVPVAIPPGMDPGMAKSMIEYLRSNPEAAKATYDEAQRLLQSPAMAAQLAQTQSIANAQTPEQRERLLKLKSDPELKAMFDEIESKGPAAMERYWNDYEMMSKVSKKLNGMNVSSPESSSQPQKTGSKYRSESLHDAAKVGDVEALKRLIQDGADVNLQDERGITPLGVAVGFNRLEVIRELLAAHADVEKTDRMGNTPLHYAAGYGRKEAAEQLLDAGATPAPLNQQGQTPSDAAKQNRELHMVTFLQSRTKGEENTGYL